jgi:hypothetical protein
MPVWVSRPGEGPRAHPSLLGRTRDVSTRGAFLWVSGQHEVGSRLRLRFEVPASVTDQYAMRLSCDAEVVRVEPALVKPEERGLAVRVLSFDPPEVALGGENFLH